MTKKVQTLFQRRARLRGKLDNLDRRRDEVARNLEKVTRELKEEFSVPARKPARMEIV